MNPGASESPPDAAPISAPVNVRLLVLVFLPFAAGYFCSFLFRNVNSVVFPELTREFGLSPGTLGLLTSAYFVTFAGAQLPLGRRRSEIDHHSATESRKPSTPKGRERRWLPPRQAGLSTAGTS